MKNSASEAWSSLQYQTDVQGRFQFSEEIKDSSLIAVLRFHQVGWGGEERMCLPLG